MSTEATTTLDSTVNISIPTRLILARERRLQFPCRGFCPEPRLTGDSASRPESSNMEDGNRITIDSATLMNKGFEVIEACWLFDSRPQVDVVIHPQSSVHAMIEYSDGSVLAQISATDMRMPIQYALTYPDRCEAPVPKWTGRKREEWSSATGL